MRFLTADYLYPLHTSPIKEGVLQLAENGEVISILKNRKSVSLNNLEVFKGALCPGFVNAHCHLELSHLYGAIKKGNGLLNFIISVKNRRNFDKENILKAIASAEQQMIHNGIVAVGDICNTSDTLIQKKIGNIKYYNFIEVFGVHEKNAKNTIIKAKKLRAQFLKIGLKSTISPHAPYSVSTELMQEIKKSFDEKDELMSIHIQETARENDLFTKKKGDFLDWLKSINASPLIWESRSRSTDIFNELGNKKTLMVHNTFVEEHDITSNYYCTCPKSNLYIEKRVPNYSFFDPNKLCVGTDSLASNDSLSVLEELKIIRDNSNFDFNTLLKIASKNGAEALGFKELGTFEKGKKPGVNLISGLNKVEIIA